MRKLFRITGLLALGVLAALLVAGGLLAVEVLSREPLRTVASTTHPTLPRAACLDCHAPIADEWRESYHYRSLTGPYWEDVRRLGYLDFFNRMRKPCVNCHAPSNVLDLAAAAPAAGGEAGLGVECTPNIFRDPEGLIPGARADDVELGVDCTACHVDARGVVGAGRRPAAEHGTVADRRFQDPVHASEALCATCHGSTVEAWRRTSFAADGVDCLDCHMPEIDGPSVVGGPDRRRRSHRFPADKDDTLLARAVHATLEITGEGHARFRIFNDRVGHYFPSGGNWLSVRLEARDSSGRMLAEHKEAFGREETLVLDFWPFNQDGRIPSGGQREIVLPLPAGHGAVEAAVSYHDWMKTKRTLLTLRKEY